MMRAAFSVWVLCATVACHSAPTPAAAREATLKGQDAGPDAERIVKARSVGWPSRPDTGSLTVRQVQLPPAEGQRVTASNILVDGRDLLVVDNRRGRLFRVPGIADAHGAPLTIEAGPHRLTFPVNARTAADGTYVQDENGLSLLRRDGSTAKRVRLFHTLHDFVSLRDGSFLLNAPSHREPEPVLRTIDADGHPVGAWQEPRSLAPELGGALSSYAYLARCGDLIGVGMAHSPRFYVVGPNLEVVADVTLNFPYRDELHELATQPSLVRPNPNFFWQPQYLAGVECLDNRFFVLLDLPVVRLYELSATGAIVALHRNDTVTSGRSLKRLAGLSSGAHLVFYSIIEAEDRSRILEMSVHPGQSRVARAESRAGR